MCCCVARFDVDMSQFPTIQRIHDALIEIDAFKMTHPSQQPDSPADFAQSVDPLTAK